MRSHLYDFILIRSIALQLQLLIIEENKHVTSRKYKSSYAGIDIENHRIWFTFEHHITKGAVLFFHVL